MRGLRKNLLLTEFHNTSAHENIATNVKAHVSKKSIKILFQGKIREFLKVRNFFSVHIETLIELELLLPHSNKWLCNKIAFYNVAERTMCRALSSRWI